MELHERQHGISNILKEARDEQSALLKPVPPPTRKESALRKPAPPSPSCTPTPGAPEPRRVILGTSLARADFYVATCEPHSLAGPLTWTPLMCKHTRLVCSNMDTAVDMYHTLRDMRKRQVNPHNSTPPQSVLYAHGLRLRSGPA